MDIARQFFTPAVVTTDRRVPFAQFLDRICAELANELGGSDAVLFLYDERADAFTAVAALGSGEAVRGQVLAGELAGDLGEAVQELYVHLHPSDALTAAGLSEVFAGKQVLFVPLYHRHPMGVLVVALGGQADLDLVRRARRVGARGAEEVQARRPELEHACLFSRILEVDPGGLAVVEGSDFVFSYANGAFRRALNRTTTAFLGRSVAAVMGDAGRGALARLAHVYESGEEVHDPHLVISDDLGQRFYELYLIPERTPEGKVQAIYIILWPRTEVVMVRQALESSVRELADSQRLFTAVLNNTHNGIFFVGPDLTVLYANRRMGDLFGVDVQSMVGRNKRSAITETLKWHARDPQAFEDRLFYLYDHMEETAVDEVEMAAPVRRILERYSAPVYKDDGALLGRIEVYTDVTAMRDLARNKDEFLSLVSHELRTPVTSIKGYAQLMKRRADRENLSPQMLMACSTIERQAVRMQELIDVLLDLSRLETGRLVLQLEDVNLGALTRRAVQLAQATTESHQIELTAPAADVVVRGDERRLEQVLMNLLSNAVRYSPDGGAIEVHLDRNGREAVIQVRDHGLGIPPEHRERVFERFYRVANQPESTGMGIGLHITRGIVQRHGGTVRADSVVGEGSTFTVTLPIDGPDGDEL